MSIAIRSMVLATLVVSAALVGGSSEGRAQTATASLDVLSALLVEVRGLRAAMEQMASAGPRVQLALGRLQLQEQRVNTLVRRLEEVKASLAQARRELDSRAERLTLFERLAREATDLDKRKEIESELNGPKREVARATLEVQRLQNDETTLSQDISAEQGRWSQINQQLEELERSLGRLR
jgi:predicted  nucleic acid-binding Zn-ribbon protein